MHLGGVPQSSRLTAAYGVGKQRLPRRRAVCGRREDVLPRAVRQVRRKGAPGQRDAGGWAGDGMGEERLDHGARAASSLTASCVSQAAMMQARGRTEQRPRDPSDPIQMAQ
jgi:hypothetical protein